MLCLLWLLSITTLFPLFSESLSMILKKSNGPFLKDLISVTYQCCCLLILLCCILFVKCLRLHQKKNCLTNFSLPHPFYCPVHVIVTTHISFPPACSTFYSVAPLPQALFYLFFSPQPSSPSLSPIRGCNGVKMLWQVIVYVKLFFPNLLIVGWTPPCL